MGRRYELPAPVATALAELLGPAVHDVRIYEHSWIARLHRGMVATTRPGRIYLRGAGEDFARDAALLLHEYYHVVRQWRPGMLSRSRYVADSLRHGYWNNRFEIDAREFTARALPLLKRSLQIHSGSGSAPNASRSA